MTYGVCSTCYVTRVAEVIETAKAAMKHAEASA
jgi:hypothetical protein